MFKIIFKEPLSQTINTSSTFIQVFFFSVFQTSLGVPRTISEPKYDFTMATKKDPIATKAGFKAFRENEPNWNPPLGEHWKFLGRIASTRAAVIAHYRYENEEADEDDEDPKHTKNLVLKVHYPIDKEGNRPNGYPKNYRGHRYEEQFLYDLSGYYQYAAAGKKLVPPRPKNILRQYGSQLVHYGESEEPYNISFLEYCPGVVWNEARRYNLDVFDGCEFIEEIDIWLIFKQFTRMLMMMDTGNEVFPETEATRRRQPWWGHEICHYDIEPRNSRSLYCNVRYGF